VPQLTQHDITKLYSQIGKTYEEGGKDGRWKRKSGEREREREREGERILYSSSRRSHCVGRLS